MLFQFFPMKKERILTKSGQRLFKLIKLAVLLSLTVSACSKDKSGSDSLDSGTVLSKESDTENTDSLVEETNGLVCPGITSIDMPTVPAINGQYVFRISKSEPAVDLCSVTGYIVGHPDSMQIQYSSSGTYVINEIPPGDYDIIIAATLTSESGDDIYVALRKPDVRIHPGIQTNDLEVVLPIAGTLKGNITLFDSLSSIDTDATIAGTKFSAKSNAKGDYVISGVPVGTHELILTKPGFHAGQVGKIVISDSQEFTAPPITLVAATEEGGFLQLNFGDDSTQSTTVDLVIGPPSDAVMMNVSMELNQSTQDEGFKWDPILTTMQFTFPTAGVKKLYVKFLRENGFESVSYTDTINIDPFPEVLPLIINSEAVSTSSRILALNHPKPSQADEMIVSESSDFSGADWITAADSSSFTAAEPGTDKNIYLKFRDAALWESETVFASINIDLFPVGFTLSINSNSTDTDSTTVNLVHLPPSNAIQMRVGENSDLSGALWISAASTSNYTYNAVGLNRFLYLQFRDADNWESPIANDSINIDIFPAMGELIINGGVNPATSRTVNLAHPIPANGNEMIISESSAFAGGTWVSATPTSSFTYAQPGSGQSIYVKFRDLDNWESPSMIKTVDVDLFSDIVAMNINFGNASADSRTLNLAHPAPANATHFMASEANDFSSASWIPITATSTFTVASPGSGKTVYLKFKDNDNFESAVLSDSIDVNLFPTLLGLTIDAGATVSTDRVVNLSHSVPTNGSQIRISENSDFSGTTWISAISDTTYTFTTPGSKTVYAQFRDSDNFESASMSDTITVDLFSDMPSLILNSGTDPTNSLTVSIAHSAPANASQMRLSQLSDFSDVSWIASTSTSNFVFSSPGTNLDLYVMFRDTDLFESPTLTDTITVDLFPNAAVISPVIDTADLTVDITITEPGPSTNMRYCTNSTFDNCSWVVFSNSVTMDLEFTGSHTIYFQFKETNGFLSDITSTIVNLWYPAVSIFSNGEAYSVIKSNGSVITWGNGPGADSTSSKDDNSNEIHDQMEIGVTSISVSGGDVYYGAFAALKTDGSVITWGSSSYGGDSTTGTDINVNGIHDLLESGVTSIASNQFAFAAIKSDGSVITWGDSSFGGDSVTGNDSSNSNGIHDLLESNVSQIVSTSKAFAALKGDGSVVTWGDASFGGDSTTTYDDDTNGFHDLLESGVTALTANINSTSGSFAAINSGFVVTWGGTGGDSTTNHDIGSNGIHDLLESNVTSIVSNGFAFAAIKSNGSVVTWGNASEGGDSSNGNDSGGSIVGIHDLMESGVSSVVACGDQNSGGGAFAALKSDGSVVTWGNASYGGDAASGNDALGAITGVHDLLESGVTAIYSTKGAAGGCAFAALKTDSVVTWGASTYGGDSTTGNDSGGSVTGIHDQLETNVANIFSTSAAFAALKSDGSVVTWGNSFYGGDSTTNLDLDSDNLHDLMESGVSNIFVTYGAFAALKSNGSVVSWGDTVFGGNATSGFDSNVNGIHDLLEADVSNIYPSLGQSGGAFAAKKTDGTIVTWGIAEYGGDSTSVGQLLRP